MTGPAGFWCRWCGAYQSMRTRRVGGRAGWEAARSTYRVDLVGRVRVHRARPKT